MKAGSLMVKQRTPNARTDDASGRSIRSRPAISERLTEAQKQEAMGIFVNRSILLNSFFDMKSRTIFMYGSYDSLVTTGIKMQWHLSPMADIVDYLVEQKMIGCTGKDIIYTKYGLELGYAIRRLHEI